MKKVKSENIKNKIYTVYEGMNTLKAKLNNAYSDFTENSIRFPKLATR